jgi:hypothetical protein
VASGFIARAILRNKMAKKEDTVEKKYDDLTKVVTSLETSASWAKGITVLLVPTLLIGVVYAVMMYSSHREIAKDVDAHLRHHTLAIAPTINQIKIDIVQLKAERGEIKENMKNLKHRVDANEFKIQELNKSIIFDRQTSRKRAIR